MYRTYDITYLLCYYILHARIKVRNKWHVLCSDGMFWLRHLPYAKMAKTALHGRPGSPRADLVGDHPCAHMVSFLPVYWKTCTFIKINRNKKRKNRRTEANIHTVLMVMRSGTHIRAHCLRSPHCGHLRHSAAYEPVFTYITDIVPISGAQCCIFLLPPRSICSKWCNMIPSIMP